MPNPFVHVELQTTDIEKAKAFYKGLFKWDLEKAPGMDYTLIKVGSGTGGGMMQTPKPNLPSHWMAYVGVDDVAAALKKAKSLGATICMEATDVGGHGIMGVFIDPTGAALALWQEIPKKK
ncbi:MAG TPA: VOC family protein [Elusimicrobiota bacterium]|nr:VOC family protein [Elusimicrobiota bacterium]